MALLVLVLGNELADALPAPADPHHDAFVVHLHVDDASALLVLAVADALELHFEVSRPVELLDQIIDFVKPLALLGMPVLLAVRMHAQIFHLQRTVVCELFDRHVHYAGFKRETLLSLARAVRLVVAAEVFE
eukprot:CAMPEP_0116902932 /NCGR_PEP_ID=MMETSP0467-20121206/10396_1 /TAXON_ID=283647 /ORGANISM="Mesodinium pulex, Strain SPMC105" /LENGTH=131 /DNA_ID=CAMNT_0004577037 /DNA_START=338 /DNA_END=733 /DNA_ORIENTATION=+